MKLFLRSAEPEELPDIIQVQNLSLRILASPNLTAATTEALIAHQQTQREQLDELILVVSCNGQIVGFISLLIAASQISGLFVHPDFVRQGIGTELLTAAEEIMLAKSRRSLYVLSSEYAKDFYKKRGFRLIRRSYLSLNRHDKIRVFWMQKQLRELTAAEKQQRTISLIILGLVLIVSLWAAIA